VEVGSQFVVEDAGADLAEQWAPRGVQRICCFFTNRWKAALNAFEITFDGRLSAGRQ